jgi:predicted aldo/keto reductase-like oxidoreductase
MTMKRRAFLKAVGGVAGTCALGVDSLILAERPGQEVAALPRRTLGRTGERVSIVGFPGLALVHYDQDRCTAGIQDAFERGVNYFDVAPAYGDGDAETKLGIGLQGIDRSRVFLACKTKMRGKQGARKELERSLKRLKTDYFDLYQMHAIRRPEEVKQALGPNGAIQTFLKAKEEGKVRFFGFSAHTTKGALEAMNGFRFDTVMFPINFIEFFSFEFGKPILELADEQGAAVLAIKPMCGGAWPKGVKRTRKWWYRPLEKQGEIDLGLHFTLSQKCVSAGIPPAFLDLLDKAITAGRSYSKITEPQIVKLREMAKTRKSIFRREEQRVARHGPPSEPVYVDSPHECCSVMHV